MSKIRINKYDLFNYEIENMRLYITSTIGKKYNLKKTYLFNFVITEIVYNFIH